MKKLMFAIPKLAGGGAERVTAVLASQICCMDDYEVHMVTYERDPANDYPLEEGVIRHSMDREAGFAEKIRYLRGVIQDVRPGCVISLGGAGIAALLAVSVTGLGVPLILSERNDPRNDPRSPHLRILRQLAYRRCDGVVFQTHEAMEFFSKSIRRKSQVICNPLTGNLPERFEGIREKRIVTCCRLNTQKNLDLMIDAFSDIAQRFDTYTLHIYGEGEERSRLEEKIRAMGLENRVFLPGYSNQIYHEIRKAALYVSSSDYEGISNSMLEAIALGIPTVCTDCPAGGARETIRHGVNGLLVPVRDREKLADAMAEVLENEQFARMLSMEGEKLRSAISREAIARQWLNFVQQVEKKHEHK